MILKGKTELEKFKQYLIGEKRSIATQEKYGWHVRKMLETINKEPTNITQDDLDQYKIHLAKHYSQNSMIPQIAAINMFFNHILKNKDMRLKAPQKIVKNKISLTVEEVQRMFNAAKDNPMDYAILQTFYYTGIRRSELENLNISDIDFEKGKLRINKGKGNDYSTINIHPNALEAIRKYLPYRIKPIDDSDALFVSSVQRRIARTPIWNRVKKYAVKAGITKRVYPHLFRVSMITHMAENGANVRDIQAQSRHKDIDTLMGYINPTDEHIRNVYLKTLPTMENQHIQTDRKPRKTMEVQFTDMQRKKSLFDKYMLGEIDRETFKKALDFLEQKESKKQNDFSMAYS